MAERLILTVVRPEPHRSDEVDARLDEPARADLCWRDTDEGVITLWP